MTSVQFTRAILIVTASTLSFCVSANEDLADGGVQPNGESPLLSFAIENMSGDKSRLTYVANDGWQVDHRAGGPEAIRTKQVAVAKEMDNLQPGRPVSVFVDGPSGFTYVWLPDQGWRFVGRITKSAPTGDAVEF
ncbi:hypothetical protein [Caballeronia novacaledonica]|uniref:Lipoprotein n=1 Tax=Caballeronia novacaledonica TaxID=1544861 RepID=A0AA37IGH6_9BURK|nr:hypothetical protein [Caballeronia novacaledonica]GJH28913.1 hypothetical protein CBA19CS42_30375 [Caballeronia novacaledonica]